MKKIILILLSLLITSNYAYADERIYLENDHNNVMDTSNWITHPIGRYLIKLPPSAQIKWAPLSFCRRYYVETKADGYRFYEDKRHFKLYNEGMGYEYSPMKGEDEVTANTQNLINNFSAYVKENIQAHSQAIPLANTSGIYFENGFLPDPTNKGIIYPYEEGISIEITFPDRYGMYLKISFNQDKGYYPVTYGEDTKIADKEAKEILMLMEIDANINDYQFLASTREVGYHSTNEQYARDYLTIMLESPYVDTHNYLALSEAEIDLHWRRIKASPAFKSHEEAIAFFNAIKANIRLRPDGVDVPLPPEAQGKPYFIIYDKIIPYGM